MKIFALNGGKYFILKMQEYPNFYKLGMNCKLGILLFY